jgi:hypothetical protein
MAAWTPWGTPLTSAVRTSDQLRLQIQRVGGVYVALRGYRDAAAAHDQRGAIAERRIRCVSAGESHVAKLDPVCRWRRHRGRDEAGARNGDTSAKEATTGATQ